MWEVITVSSIAVLIAWLARYRDCTYALEAAFVLLACFLSVRYEYGNDYEAYVRMYSSINEYVQLQITSDLSDIEYGWILLNRLFRPLGFFSLVIVLSCVQLYTYYYLIKKYVPREWYWLALFVYLFTPMFMLTQLSMLRQTLAMSIVVCAFEFSFKRKLLPAAALMGLAGFFHMSAWVLAPLIFLSYWKFRFNWVGASILLACFVGLFILKEQVLSLISSVVDMSFQKYDDYLEDELTITYGAGFAFMMFMLLLMLFFEPRQNKNISILFKLAIISFMLYPVGTVIPIISRLGLYISIYSIIAYPFVILSIRKVVPRVLILVFYVFFTLYSLQVFFTSDIWQDNYAVYHTIFQAPEWQ